MGNVLLSDIMRCASCGFDNRDRAVFCEKCGTGLQAPKPSYHVQALDRNARRRGIASRFSGKSFLGIAIGIVLIVLGILAYFVAIGAILGSAEDAGSDPLGTAGDILGGIGMMVLAVILIAIGGIVLFIGIIWVVFRVAGG